MDFHLFPTSYLPLPLVDSLHLAHRFFLTNGWAVEQPTMVQQERAVVETVFSRSVPRQIRPGFRIDADQIVWELRSSGSGTLVTFKFLFSSRAVWWLNTSLCILYLFCWGTLGSQDKILSLIGGFTGLGVMTLLCAWSNSGYLATIEEFGKRVHEECGVAPVLKRGGVGFPSGHWLMGHAFFLATVMWWTFAPRFNYLTRAPSFPLFFALIVLLGVAWLVGGVEAARRQPILPSLWAGAAVITYCSWPEMTQSLWDFNVFHDDNLSGSDGSVLQLVTLVVLPAGTMWCLSQVARLRGNSVKSLMYGLRLQTDTGRVIRIEALLAVVFWCFLLAVEIRAIVIVGVNISGASGKPITAILSAIWILPLILIYRVMVSRAIREYRCVRNELLLAKTEGAVLARVRQLATDCCIRPPLVAISAGETRVEWCLGIGLVLKVGEQDRQELDADALDGLILHELYHAKEHALISLLKAAAPLALCGRGVLSEIIETRALEIAADQFAKKQLDESKRPGEHIMSELLGTLLVRRTHNKEQGNSGSIAHVLFDDDSWYAHPSFQERLAALSSPTCPH